MIYTPEYESYVIEPVTTANKNIQSNFMRTDKSYYGSSLPPLPAYDPNTPPFKVIVDGDCLVALGKSGKVERTDMDLFVNGYFNLEKYKTSAKCMSELYRILHEKEMESLSFVQLIVSDFFNRSVLTGIIDVVLKQIGFKGVMVLPLSLSISVGVRSNYCSLIFREGFGFIDDFVRADAYMPGMKQMEMDVDDQDFVEEFTRLQLLDETMKYSCDLCDQKEETEEKIKQHVEKEHANCGYFYYEKGGTFTEEFNSRLRYLFGKGKADKIGGNVYSVGVDFEGSETIENPYEIAFQGASMLASLKHTRELWLMNSEWAEWRLRLLKEKVLFFI